MNEIDPQIIKSLEENPNDTASQIADIQKEIRELTPLKAELQKLIEEAKKTKEAMSWTQTLTYFGFLVLLLMVAGMLFDFFSVRRAETGSVGSQPVVNNYYGSRN